MPATTAAVIVLAIVVLLLGAAGAGLLRRIRELELTVYRGVGRRIGGSDGQQNSALATVGRISVVAKLTRRCPVCAEVLQAMSESVETVDGAVDLVVLADSSDAVGQAPIGLRVVADSALWRVVDVPFVPALLITDEHGVVVYSAPAGSGAVVTEVIRRATAMSRAEAP